MRGMRYSQPLFCHRELGEPLGMPQKFLSIRNFEKYQKTKTKEGTRPWVKLWKTLLDDPEFMKLSPDYRFIYTGLILLADDCENKIYADSTYLRQRLYITHTEGIRGTYIGHTQLDLKPLYRAGFLNTSNLYRVLSEKRREEAEKRREEKEETPSAVCVVGDFDEFWELYPRKVGKEDARKAWKRCKDRPANALLLPTVRLQMQSEQWRKGFIPNPATWLNQQRWNDELPTVQAKHAIPPFPPSTDPIARNSWRQAYGDPKEHGY